MNVTQYKQKMMNLEDVKDLNTIVTSLITDIIRCDNPLRISLRNLKIIFYETTRNKKEAAGNSL